MGLEAVTRCCCIFENEKITAFYTGKELEKKDIVKYLREKLPVFMIPADIIHLDEFVLNKNGKIDRNVLKGLLNER